MIARVARLSTAGAHMTYPIDATLVGRHGTVSSTTLFFMLFVVLASLLSRNRQANYVLTKNVLMARHLLLGKLGKNAIWDVTVTETLAMSYLNSTSATAGSAAEQASARKEKSTPF